jgi:hypothetical protein
MNDLIKNLLIGLGILAAFYSIFALLPMVFTYISSGDVRP